MIGHRYTVRCYDSAGAALEVVIVAVVVVVVVRIPVVVAVVVGAAIAIAIAMANMGDAGSSGPGDIIGHCGEGFKSGRERKIAGGTKDARRLSHKRMCSGR